MLSSLPSLACLELAGAYRVDLDALLVPAVTQLTALQVGRGPWMGAAWGRVGECVVSESGSGAVGPAHVGGWHVLLHASALGVLPYW